jgi:hypothetical protein
MQRGLVRVLGIAALVVALQWSGEVVRAADAEVEESSIRPGGRPERRPDLTPAQVDEVMAFVEQHFPIAYDVLGRLEERNPRVFRRRIQHMAPRIFEMKRAVQEDPPIGRLLVADFRLESEIIELRRQYREARDPATKQSLRGELEGLIGRQFDVQLQRQSLLLERLETRLDAQRKRVERQAERRDQIVNERLLEALNGGRNDAESGDE